MKLWKNAVIFYLGGMLYTLLELLWRGWSHGSMFVVGGLCFLMICAVGRGFPQMPLFMQAVMCALGVTAVELVSGLIINKLMNLNVWDYSTMPYNVFGQVCVGYFFLWFLVSIVGIVAAAAIRRGLFGEETGKMRLL